MEAGITRKDEIDGKYKDYDTLPLKKGKRRGEE
jgi:hypothetical protein